MFDVRPSEVRRIACVTHDCVEWRSADEALRPRNLDRAGACWSMLLDELIASEIDLSAEILPHGGSSTR
jgi:hypothetical protein